MCRYVLLRKNQRFSYHRLDLHKFTFQDSLCAPRRAPVVQLGERLDIGYVFIHYEFLLSSWGKVGETLYKIIRCDGFNKGLTVVYVLLMLNVS